MKKYLRKKFFYMSYSLFYLYFFHSVRTKRWWLIEILKNFFSVTLDFFCEYFFLSDHQILLFYNFIITQVRSLENMFNIFYSLYWASLMAQMVKHLLAMRETWVWSLGWEDPLEKEMATHSSTLAWKIPWTEKPGRLQTMGSQRVRHDWTTSL